VVLKGLIADQEPRDIRIEMVLLGGKQRSVTAFRALAGQAGLDVIAAERQAAGYFVAECLPA
jgi:hypothetical protein